MKKGFVLFAILIFSSLVILCQETEPITVLHSSATTSVQPIFPLENGYGMVVLGGEFTGSGTLYVWMFRDGTTERKAVQFIGATIKLDLARPSVASQSSAP